jgi:hypothetical protein
MAKENRDDQLELEMAGNVGKYRKNAIQHKNNPGAESLLKSKKSYAMIR